LKFPSKNYGKDFKNKQTAKLELDSFVQSFEKVKKSWHLQYNSQAIDVQH